MALTTTKTKRQAIDTFSLSFPASVDRNSVCPRILKPCNSSVFGCVYLHRPTRATAPLKKNANQIPDATDPMILSEPAPRAALMLFCLHDSISWLRLCCSAFFALSAVKSIPPHFPATNFPASSRRSGRLTSDF